MSTYLAKLVTTRADAGGENFSDFGIDKEHLLGIIIIEGWSVGVIIAYSLNEIGFHLDILIENPGADHDIFAGIVLEVIGAGALLFRLIQPGGVDLHDAIIKGAVIVGHGDPITAAFDKNNRHDELCRDGIGLCCLINAGNGDVVKERGHVLALASVFCTFYLILTAISRIMRGMNYTDYFHQSVNAIKAEHRYRVFRPLHRDARFPVSECAGHQLTSV